MGALIGGGVATLLSLFVLSRAVADNPLYRFALSLLVGTALGYVAAVLLRSALVPPIAAIIDGRAATDQLVVTIAGLVLGLLVLTRFGRQRSSYLANFPLALLFGVGAALALVGAVRGTIAPQLLDTVRLRGLEGGSLGTQIGAGVLAILTIITLLSFTFTVPAGGDGQATESRTRQGFRYLGRMLILLTFGVFFAATVRTYIAALVGQIVMIADWIVLLFGS
jgi:hypothetical protein